jgi:M6 family metalloprotease-like protein
MQNPYTKIGVWVKRTRIMGFKKFLVYISLLLLTISSSASPARRGPVILTQPDGTSFSALLKGDEFTRIKTTTEGHAIIQDENGWWCYAIYESDGSKYNSGYRVGQDTPSLILNQSCDIPRNVLTRSGLEKRQELIQYHTRSTATTFQNKALFQSRALVILAQFEDIRFLNTKEDFEALLMSENYERDGATGCAREYFEYQFNGMVDFVFDVSDIVTLPAQRAYYGANDNRGNDLRPETMIADACELAAQSGVDFSMYDGNNDGKVDNVFVFFAGEDEAEGADENSIWSHSWYLFSGAGVALELNGKLIDRYACSSEMTRVMDTSTGRLIETRLCGIGTFCHEYGHTFGLPDLYDTDYEDNGGWAAGLWGSTALMDAGNQNNQGNTPPNFNAVERDILGLSTSVIIDSDGKFILSPINTYGEFYRINTDVEGEYYLLECRFNEPGSWDEFIGGNGMLVYHIDKTEMALEQWDRLNTVNADPSHQYADLVEADGRSDTFTDYLDYLTRRKNLEGLFFPYLNTNSLPANGNPGLKFWSGENKNISIINIERDTTAKVSFNVIGYSEDSTPPYIKGYIRYEVFCDGAILSFETDRPYSGEAFVSYKQVGGEAIETSVMPFEDGRYAIMLEGLDPVKTYTASVHFVHNEIKGPATSVSFMTKKKPAISWPYITFGTVTPATKKALFEGDDSWDGDGVYEKGSRIPLKINNAKGAKNILWFFNRQPITHDGDLYYTLTESGTLKAHVYMEDGQEFIIVKEILVE